MAKSGRDGHDGQHYFFYINFLMEEKNCKSPPKNYKIPKKSKNNVKISFEIVFLCPFGAIWQFTVIYILVWPTVVTMATMAWGTVICLIYYESEEKYWKPKKIIKFLKSPKNKFKNLVWDCVNFWCHMAIYCDIFFSASRHIHTAQENLLSNTL